LGEPRVWTAKITKIAIKNDILMSVRAPVGPVNINSLEKICIGRGLASIRVNNENEFKYVFFYLQSIENEIQGGNGAVFDSINKEQVAEIKIPRPPLEIQRQIVEKLDRQMQALEGVRLLKSEAEKRIEELLSQIWLDHSKNK
jgi:restriction endonuclease S subunit